MVKRRIADITASVLLIVFAAAAVSPALIIAARVISGGIGPFVDFYVWNPVYLRGIANSLFISLISSFGTVVVSVFAAYVFAKVKFRGRSALFFMYIIVMIMPFQVTLLPQYIVSRRLMIYDTPWSMILPGIFAPFAAFLLTQIIKTVPNEMIEAARLETDSTFIIVTRIIAPIIRPGIICAWVLSFTEQWNAVAEPIILLETKDKYPLSVLLNDIWTNDLLGFAAVLLLLLPPLLIFLFFEDEVIEGLKEYRLK